MNKLYKSTFLTIGLLLGLGLVCANAQENDPNSKLEKTKKQEKEWDEWAKKFEKSFENFNEKLKSLDFANAEFKENLKKIGKSLDELEIPPIPPVPPINSIDIEINKKLDGIVKTKKLTKSYPASNGDLLLISNSYGKIIVNTWDKNEVKVDVEIKVTASSEDKAAKLLDAVTITNGKTADQISFKTVIEKQESGNSWMSSSYWSGGNNGQNKTDIFYTVYMPAKMAIYFKTNYTTIELPNLGGNITLNMNYGDLKGNNLTNKLNLRTNYTKVQFVSANDVTLSCNYGSVKIDNVNGLNGNLNYCSANIGTLSGTSTLSMNYSGGFKINSLAKDFKTLNINANYSGISLNFEDSIAFNFDVKTTYASLSYNDKVTITEKTPAEGEKSYSTSKSYKGVYGKSPQGNINIISNYGSVKFN
jgi:hypothetical protein